MAEHQSGQVAHHPGCEDLPATILAFIALGQVAEHRDDLHRVGLEAAVADQHEAVELRDEGLGTHRLPCEAR